MKTNQVLKEWNGVVEALGQGKQTIMIRVYKTNKKKVLLYPTWNYLNNMPEILDGFKNEFKEFIADNSKSEDQILIKYFAKIEDVFESKMNDVKKISKNYLWTEEHIKSYLNNRKPYIWLLRVYELENPTTVEQVSGQIYGRLHRKIDLSNSKPVLTDNEFKKISEEIMKIKK